jgi:hypothetical protein
MRAAKIKNVMGVIRRDVVHWGASAQDGTSQYEVCLREHGSKRENPSQLSNVQAVGHHMAGAGSGCSVLGAVARFTLP